MVDPEFPRKSFRRPGGPPPGGGWFIGGIPAGISEGISGGAIPYGIPAGTIGGGGPVGKDIPKTLFLF